MGAGVNNRAEATARDIFAGSLPIDVAAIVALVPATARPALSRTLRLVYAKGRGDGLRSVSGE